MSLFKPAENTMAYSKIGFMGEQGGGKTYTATLLAIGLVKYLRERGIAGSDKPAYMLDTENGSSWIKPLFEENGIRLEVAKTRAFKDLVPALRDAEKNASVLLIDSISHFWIDLQNSYLEALSKRRGRTVLALEFQDWAYVKREWGKFTDAFVSSDLHCILCGRLAWEYDQVTNERGKKEIEKSGARMAAEKGLGYEPNMLVWMERDMDLETRVTSITATVLKDRSRKLDGKRFQNPTFATFLPHIEFMALGGKHETTDMTRNSVDIMPDDDVPLSDMKSVRRKIALDEIQALLVEHYPSTGAEDKKAKAALIKQFFHTTSWTEIETLMPLVDLQSNFDALHRKLTGKPSRYGVQEPEPQKQESAEADAEHLQDLIGGADADAPKVETSAPAEQEPQAPKADALPAADDPLDMIMDLRADLDSAHNMTRVAECLRRWRPKFDAASEATRLLMDNERERAVARIKKAFAA